MEPTDLTVEILKSIRDEVRSTNVRVDGMRDEIRSTNTRLDGLREDVGTGLGETNARLDRLERRQSETEVRLATELVAVASAIHEVRDLLREDRALRQRVDDHERRITVIETRVG